MRITPLVIHAQMHLPRFTARFSDAFDVSSMAVEAGALVTLTCAKPHGVKIGARISLSVTDADVPNAITAASVDGDGNVVLTTAYSHDLTLSPDPDRFRVWNTTCKLSGFTNAYLNGNRQIVSIPDRSTVVVKPGGTVASVTLNGAEKLLERLEQGIIGWHACTAASATTLTFPTPAMVTRDYTVVAPSVVRNARVYGALDIDSALAQLTEPGDNQRIDRAHLFITPLPSVRTSRSRSARSDAIGEHNPGADVRMLLLDGFNVVMLAPSVGTAAHVAAIDLAQGEALRAVLRTFQGLKIPRPELENGGEYTALLQTFGAAMTANRAIYIHQWTFQAPAYVTNEDAISPWDWPDPAIAGETIPDTIAPIGTTVIEDIDLGGTLPDGRSGIIHDSKPGALAGIFTLEDAS